MRTRESIDDLLNEKEGEFCQFKEWKTKSDLKEAAKICCALANRGGGKLVLGVTDKRPRKVVGSTAFPQPERSLADLMDKLRIRIDFDIYQHENGRILVFHVASSPIGLPIQVDGIAWWYRGDSLIPMPEKIRRTIYAEAGHDFSGDICLDATIDDLDIDAVDKFRKTWAEYSGNKRIASLSVEQLLRDCGALTDDEVTYRILNKECGLSTYRFMNQIRNETAVALLESGKLSAAEVAVQSGFGSYLKMLRSLKRGGYPNPTEIKREL